MALSGKEKRALRAVGHHLIAIVQVGANGVTEGVIKATRQALDDHELVKVRIADEREGRAQAIAELARGTQSEVAQTLGRTVLLFKKKKKDSAFGAIGGPVGPRAPAPAAPQKPDKKGSKKPPRTASAPRTAVEWYEDDEVEG